MDNIFTSCDECIEALTKDYCWCWEANERDYYQVFMIALAIILMYLASYCLGYAQSSATIGGMSQMRICFDIDKMKELKSNINKTQRVYNEEGTVSGIPIGIYLLLNAILSAIYFFIKLNIYLQDSPHYLSSINQEFEHLAWPQFYDAKIILLSTIYCHSFAMLKQNITIYNENKKRIHHPFHKGIMMICCLVLFIDFIGSIILMCIVYPLLITALYHGSIAILSGIGLLFVVCCIIPLIVCYARSSSWIFVCISCGASIEKPCGKFVRAMSNGIVFLSLYYIVICVVLCLSFVFVGGPNHVVLYLDMNESSTDRLIVSLYAAALCVGILGFLIGCFYVMCKQCQYSDDSKEGYHHPRNTNTIYEERNSV